MKATSHAHKHHHEVAAPPGSDHTSAASHAHQSPEGAAAPEAHDRHAGHSVEMFRDRFWITLLLTIPTLIWSDMIQHWFGFVAPAFTGSRYIPAVSGTAVYVYGGWVFLAGGIASCGIGCPE